jgi:carbon storage regulator
MLVLTRSTDERIVIGGGLIWITIVAVRDGRVRIGIDAPPEIAIHREEVYEAMRRQEDGREGGAE